MSLERNKRKKLFIITMVLLGMFFFSIQYFKTLQEKKLSPIKNKTDRSQTVNENKKDGIVQVQGDIIIMPTIEYKELEKNKELKELMTSRKENLGIKKSLDMIVKSDENFKIGDIQVSMRDILEKAFIKEGGIFEEKIEDSGAVRLQKIKEYGIYVVTPGDNIWNIHFNLLKDFYDHKCIKVSPTADEPDDQGMSSGIGKILKFSESMVIIYNLIEKKVGSDINLINPLSKIVIYNMGEVFSLLQEINYKNVDRIQFDGKTIWIPTKK